jgi:adenosylmethionine-8-amino-7-oxononanoate aminotransferase
MHKLAQLDHQFVWHPFTQMKDWLRSEPILIVEGAGAVLRDVRGKEYLDANSSIWTNLHGHRHPTIDRAVRQQLRKIAHSSALGFANEPASLLAAELVTLANPSSPAMSPSPKRGCTGPKLLGPELSKVFFSDDGSTALEVALKLAYEFARRSGRSQHPKFLSLAGAYHGDTIGAVSLGHIDLFHKSYAGLLFKSECVPSPYCYRCPFNRARPERADARAYRSCNWECTLAVEQILARNRKRGHPIAAMVIEPRVQGAAGMIPQPDGWLRRIAEMLRADGAQWIADEVMTGFGRSCAAPVGDKDCRRASGAGTVKTESHTLHLFASHEEGVQPDYLALAKGLTGGYLPMAATLTTSKVFASFLGDYSEFKTFFHGHSYTGNQLGAAAALANVGLLQTSASVRARAQLQQALATELNTLWSLPNIGDIRQVGLISGVELVRDWRTRKPFNLRERAGIRVCEAMARRGVLTRCIGNIIPLLPPYCTTAAQVKTIVRVLAEAVDEVSAAANWSSRA